MIAESHSRKLNNTNIAKRKLYDSTDGNRSDDDVSVSCEFPYFRAFRFDNNVILYIFPQDDCRLPNYFDDTVIPIQTNGFDADSEGSDSELVPNTNRTTEERSTMNSKR